jgi:hypothetical protein
LGRADLNKVREKYSRAAMLRRKTYLTMTRNEPLNVSCAAAGACPSCLGSTHDAGKDNGSQQSCYDEAPVATPTMRHLRMMKQIFHHPEEK